MKTITGNEVRKPYAYSGTKVSNIEEACNAVPFYIVSEPAQCSDTIAKLRGGRKELENTQNLYRSDTGGLLGQHTPQFGFLQPCDSLQTLETARALIGGEWASVAANKGGRQLMGFISLETTITAPKRGDKIGFSVGYTDFFDGTGKVGLALYANVLACDNGMVGTKSLVTFSEKHGRNLAARAKVMQERLHTNLLLEIGHTQEVIFTLDNKEMTVAEVTNFAERLFPTDAEEVSTRTENMREAIVTGFSRGTGNVGRTRFDALNAVTEYLDWQSTFRETQYSREENRLDSLINGNGARIRSRAMELLLN